MHTARAADAEPSERADAAASTGLRRWARCAGFVVLLHAGTVAIVLALIAAPPACADEPDPGSEPLGEEEAEAAAPSEAAIGADAPTDVPGGRFDRILPEWDYAPGEDWSRTRRIGGRGAKIGWDFINDSVSDSWYTLSSPVRWRWKEWLIVSGAAGATTALVFFADEPLRDAARSSERFEQFGENVRWVGQGGALLGLTGGFLLSGIVFDRPKDLDTVRLMLESALVGHGYGLAMKYTTGRSRPRTGADARSWDAFSGSVSMPSGEALNVFILAGVVTSQYPSWPVQILSYGIASAVGAGRIAVDAHWGSDVFVSAVLGIAVSKTIVKLNRIRAADRAARKRLELRGDATPSLRKRKRRHFVGATARSVRWTMVF